MTQAYFRGPLPPPALLEQYERAQPGAADRILTLAEEQQRERHKMEARERELKRHELERARATASL